MKTCTMPVSTETMLTAVTSYGKREWKQEEGKATTEKKFYFFLSLSCRPPPSSQTITSPWGFWVFWISYFGWRDTLLSQWRCVSTTLEDLEEVEREKKKEKYENSSSYFFLSFCSTSHFLVKMWLSASWWTINFQNREGFAHLRKYEKQTEQEKASFQLSFAADDEKNSEFIIHVYFPQRQARFN